MTRRVVKYSGGITSFGVAKLVIDEYGPDDVTLLFANTRVEDLDNYRFLVETAGYFGVPLTIAQDGRTPQQVNRDKRWLGNTRIAPCSHVLKQGPCRRWLEAKADPDDTVLYIGLDWTEPERVPGIVNNWAPWQVELPLLDHPEWDKQFWLAESTRLGFKPPRLYEQGFEHANCGGACVRAGQAQWAHLLEINPDLFASWEHHEDEMAELTGQRRAMLRDRRGGTTKPLPLTVLRQRVESQPTLIDRSDLGGCGCFTGPGDRS